MSLIKAAELRQKRKKLVEDARQILERAEREKRELTSEENSRWTQMHSDAEDLRTQYERIEQQEEAERAQAETELLNRNRHGAEAPTADRLVTGMNHPAFRAWMLGGINNLTPEQRAHIVGRTVNPGDPEYRALSATTNAAGGIVVPDDTRRQVVDAMKAFGGMRQAAFVLTTSQVGDLVVPTANDTGETGALLAENTQVGEQDITFSSVTLQAFKYTSKLIRVPIELLQDSGVDIDSFVREKLATRLGRITNTHYTTGDGSSKPNGVVTASTQGKVGSSATSVTHDELLDLKHSVDPAHRLNALWMFNDSTLKALKKLKDGFGRPLWTPGIAVREPDVIDSDRYVVNQDVASMASSAKSILYGDFRNYWIRDTSDLVMFRLVERYADFFQVGFLAFLRTDGDLLDAGSNPIKHFANAT